MNIRETVTIRSPNGIEEECAKFTIDEVNTPFTFNGVTEENQKYVFSAWVMADEETTLNIEEEEIPVTTEWKRQKVAYVASANPLKIYFNKTGVYYIYQVQLEIGDVMTDWSPSPEDIEEAIKSANAKLELKVNKDTLKSEINALADTFTFTGNGFVVNAKNLTITEDGTIKANNGEFNGTIKGSSGEFTEGFSVILDDGSGYAFGMIMADEGTGLFKVGYEGDEAEGAGLIEIEPGYVGIDGNNVNIGANRGVSMYSGMQIILDAPEIYVQDSIYSGESFELIEFLSRIKNQRVLWSGGYYMNDSHSIALSEEVLEQPHGIVLIWSRYTGSASANEQFHSFFIPKSFVSMHAGVGHTMFMTFGAVNHAASKYVYISNTTIKGHANNIKTLTGANGLTVDNTSFVLRYVIGV